MKTRKNKLERIEATKFYLYISPWLLGFLIFTLYPIVYSFLLIFTNADLTGNGKFIGINNIIKVFSKDPLFLKALENTLYYSFVFVPLSLIFAFLIALLLNQKLKGISIFRTSFYIPYITSGVAVTMLWGWLFNPDVGLINYILSVFGVKGPNWLNDERWAMPAIIIMSLWSIGNTIIITLAGLQDIPTQLYESAELDGANRFTITTRITIPLITPTLFFNLIIGIIGAFQIFTQPYVLTQGGPNYATYTYVLHLYNYAFKYNEIGYASTLAWILFIIIMILTLIVNYTSKYWVYYEN
ncbi:sugar ABC transporter permease [Thermoanaerobacterium sp. CMT5567-10]|uniref:carbohydrate ABC transporter permease n=1 Tax=Thermoanaerobacterium sp. CMT5567-10 TaxID=3061989 RepID=UPI0026DFEBBA|nr:sugar ABC transporter permease [Thermoanaerobacterium sp. CMT5567-10]WKV08598.1 sugar ABC transporter permease [Thermoanaerobacterium sp. CMT5567-10]